MRPFRPLRDASPPATLPALLRATHLLGIALGSALGRLRESGATAAKMFERAEEQALLLRMTREAAEILGARWDKVPERVGAQWELRRVLTRARTHASLLT
jgi:hypothetical protein